MTLRKLGNADLSVSPIAFGGNVFGWTADARQSFNLLDAWCDAGFNFVDTADVYSYWAPGNRGGESEEIIGQWFARGAPRDRIVLATKVGKPMGEGKRGLSAAYIREAVDASLRRLRTDYIDLYQAHADDPDTPLEETLTAFAELIQAGKVRAIGASNYTGERFAAARAASRQLGVPGYESLQPEYNLVERAHYEQELEPVVTREGVGVISYYSLASGFLSGKYRSQADLQGRARGAAAGKYLDARGLRVLAALDAVAKDHDATPAQISLAWLLARPSITAPIVSATSVAQLQELAGAATLHLSSDALARLDAASAPDAAC
ncbi:aldo/keto reductase [Chitinasiproducens palmae]|uniref:Predicted oxidoreductase n=1 Tax=Chitinasiproducens palmae TaxID=1770053 RepID=A0A1H2PRU9_9BURK|nr:aldo/keto reductase [Chitinasiproducens palmae]SDV49653.1 Predicted oxidoreductase [Chitinasiproducens palmae]